MMKQFLLDKMVTIGFLCIAFIFMIVFLALLKIPVITMISISLVYLLCIISWLAVNFYIMKRKVEKMNHLIQQLEPLYLIGELLPAPSSLIEQQYFEIMKIISKDAIDHVENADREAHEYKEFVEQWIHELKTPLTAMNLILANNGDTRKLRREMKRIENLTDQILQFARLQSIEKDKQFSHISLASLMNRAVKNQMDLLIAAGIQVTIEGDSVILTDQKALQFIVNQFLINSSKYCPESHVLIHIMDNGFIYEDNGIGIPKHELPRIFERGYTGTNGRKLGTSTGMGLYIVSKICKELNIHVEAESEVGQYTRFTLHFPQI